MGKKVRMSKRDEAIRFLGFFSGLGPKERREKVRRLKGEKWVTCLARVTGVSFFYFVVLGYKRKRTKEFGHDLSQSSPMLRCRHFFIFLLHFLANYSMPTK